MDTSGNYGKISNLFHLFQSQDDSSVASADGGETPAPQDEAAAPHTSNDGRPFTLLAIQQSIADRLEGLVRTIETPTPQHAPKAATTDAPQAEARAAPATAPAGADPSTAPAGADPAEAKARQPEGAQQNAEATGAEKPADAKPEDHGFHLMGTLERWGSTAGKAVGSFIGGTTGGAVGGAIGDLVGKTVGRGVDFVGNTVEHAADAVGGAVKHGVEFVEHKAEAVGGAIKHGAEWLERKAARVFDAVVTAERNAMQSLDSALERLRDIAIGDGGGSLDPGKIDEKAAELSDLVGSDEPEVQAALQEKLQRILSQKMSDGDRQAAIRQVIGEAREEVRAKHGDASAPQPAPAAAQSKDAAAHPTDKSAEPKSEPEKATAQSEPAKAEARGAPEVEAAAEKDAEPAAAAPHADDVAAPAAEEPTVAQAPVEAEPEVPARPAASTLPAAPKTVPTEQKRADKAAATSETEAPSEEKTDAPAGPKPGLLQPAAARGLAVQVRAEGDRGDEPAPEASGAHPRGAIVEAEVTQAQIRALRTDAPAAQAEAVLDHISTVGGQDLMPKPRKEGATRSADSAPRLQARETADATPGESPTRTPPPAASARRAAPQKEGAIEALRSIGAIHAGTSTDEAHAPARDFPGLLSTSVPQPTPPAMTLRPRATAEQRGPVPVPREAATQRPEELIARSSQPLRLTRDAAPPLDDRLPKREDVPPRSAAPPTAAPTAVLEGAAPLTVMRPAEGPTRSAELPAQPLVAQDFERPAVRLERAPATMAPTAAPTSVPTAAPRTAGAAHWQTVPAPRLLEAQPPAEPILRPRVPPTQRRGMAPPPDVGATPPPIARSLEAPIAKTPIVPNAETPAVPSPSRWAEAPGSFQPSFPPAPVSSPPPAGHQPAAVPPQGAVPETPPVVWSEKPPASGPSEPLTLHSLGLTPPTPHAPAPEAPPEVWSEKPPASGPNEPLTMHPLGLTPHTRHTPSSDAPPEVWSEKPPLSDPSAPLDLHPHAHVPPPDGGIVLAGLDPEPTGGFTPLGLHPGTPSEPTPGPGAAARSHRADPADPASVPDAPPGHLAAAEAGVAGGQPLFPGPNGPPPAPDPSPAIEAIGESTPRFTPGGPDVTPGGGNLSNEGFGIAGEDPELPMAGSRRTSATGGPSTHGPGHRPGGGSAGPMPGMAAPQPAAEEAVIRRQTTSVGSSESGGVGTAGGIGSSQTAEEGIATGGGGGGGASSQGGGGGGTGRTTQTSVTRQDTETAREREVSVDEGPAPSNRSTAAPNRADNAAAASRPNSPRVEAEARPQSLRSAEPGARMAADPGAETLEEARDRAPLPPGAQRPRIATTAATATATTKTESTATVAEGKAADAPVAPSRAARPLAGQPTVVDGTARSTPNARPGGPQDVGGEPVRNRAIQQEAGSVSETAQVTRAAVWTATEVDKTVSRAGQSGAAHSEESKTTTQRVVEKSDSSGSGSGQGQQEENSSGGGATRGVSSQSRTENVPQAQQTGPAGAPRIQVANSVQQQALARQVIMARMETMAPNVQTEAVAQHASSVIDVILKKAYGDEKMRSKDAGKFVALVLRSHGFYTYEHCTRLIDLASDLAAMSGKKDTETKERLAAGIMFKDVGEVEFLVSKGTPRQREALTSFLSGEKMAQAGLLHDIGKIKIPKEILYKPGMLTPEEARVMQMHPVYGAEILQSIPPLAHAAPAARHHHERFDGKGYPDRLKGQAIPFDARVIAVVDTFDAMAGDRPYRKGLPLDVCRSELIKGKGKQFDPETVDAFMEVLDARFVRGGMTMEDYKLGPGA